MSDVFEYLSDWRWRFANLYWINPASPDDPECLFIPRDEQWEILEGIYDRGEERIAILKARQLGFSTLLALICLDMIMFKSGFTCGVIDQTKEDAEKKLDKMVFAWERLPDDLRKAYQIVALNQSEMSIRLGKKAISTVYAGKNARGGTHHLLWISEWGAIQFDDPTRSDGIADGALPSAKEGIVVVETTWKGGKSGRLFTEIVEPALEMPEEYKTLKDWKVYFFAWWLDKSYRFEGNYEQVTVDCNKYLDELSDLHGIALDKKQRLWYYKMAWPKKAKRFEEFPSRLGEIFFSPTLGSVYGDYMDEAMTEGRIVNFPLGKELPFVFWDLGKRDLTVLLFVQFSGGQIKIFDCHMGRGGNWADYAKVCMEWERSHNTYLAGHYLPHDGGWKRMGTYYNKSIKESLEECGLRNIQVVPVIPKLSIGIDYVRDRLPNMVFNADNLKRVFEFDTKRISFLDAMNNYRYEPLGKDSSRVEPIHDINSHPADSLRVLAEADERGMIDRTTYTDNTTSRRSYSERAVTDFEFFG